MHSTNYLNTLITVSTDTRAVAATVPPAGKGSIAEMQFMVMNGHDYELTSDDVIFTVFADRNGVAEQERAVAREQFFAKGRPCLRTSPLAKSYGWGIYSDAEGRVALIPMGSSTYDALINDDTIVKKAAMKTAR